MCLIAGKVRGEGCYVLDNAVGLWQMKKIICSQICSVDKSPLCASIEVTYILTLIFPAFTDRPNVTENNTLQHLKG